MLTNFWQRAFYAFLNWLTRQTFLPEETMTPQPTPTPPISQEPAPSANIDTLVSWDSQKNNFHNVRVLCDLSYLTLEEKNLICACVYQESQFWNYLSNGRPVTHENKSTAGVLLSTDWGIAQINDYWHVQKYPDFPSSDFIMAHPEKAIQFMIDAYKEGGLKAWVSYSSGAYQKWLQPNSPMWLLK